MRTLVLVDGEHYPPVVLAALESLPVRLPGCHVVGAAFLGGTEKVADGAFPDLGVPIVGGATPDDALQSALARFRPDLVVDLSDHPVVDARSRLRLAARALVVGVPYCGADFRFDPPPRPRLSSKPTVAVIGTGKRTGKTAVTAELSRALSAAGRPPVVVTMGRGGPPRPEVVDPARNDLSPRALVALAGPGRHAASDHFEIALSAGVATVGTRRCGGGLVGAPFDDTMAAGVALANARPEKVIVLDGSGQAIPPVHADVTVCVVPATADPELVAGYLGPYRVLLSDLVVITMAEQSLADSGADVVADSVRGLAPGVRMVTTVFRPNPLGPISGRRIFYVTSAPSPVVDLLADDLERRHDCTVVGTSPHLAHRQRLAEDLQRVGRAEVLVVELKAAAIDLAARVALERGLEVVFCDNRVVAVGGASFEEPALAAVDLAIDRHREA